MALEQLTERQGEVLEKLRESTDSNRCFTTIRQLGDALGINSLNGVVHHLKVLERKGYITTDSNVHNGIRLT